MSQGLDGQTLARELGWSGAKLSRIEQGKIGISVTDLGSALAALGAPEEIRAELLAAAASELGAWLVRAGGETRRQANVGDLEQRVESVYEYHPLLIPGQLQSRDYTRAMASAAGFDPDQVARARARRQSLLAVEDGPQYCCLLDERSLQRYPGDVEVMIKQIDHLLVRMQLPNVSVRLLPADGLGGAKTLALGAFVIYRFRGATPAVVLLEHHAVDTYLATPDDAEQYQQMFDNLSVEAYSPAQTIEWLTTRRTTLERQRT